MKKKTNVFISWSGERSRVVADALYEWLPMVVQSVRPWMSSHSIAKGSRSGLEMAKALDGTRVGITCLTPENLTEPWILYEAGCLTKTIDDSTRLCTYLLGGLKNKDIQPPLSQFQHTSPSPSETRELVDTINEAIGGDDRLNEKTLDAIFKQFWPTLKKTLDSFPDASQPAPKRSAEDMLAEILEFTRSETNRRLNVPQIVNFNWEDYPVTASVGYTPYDLSKFRFADLTDSNKLKIIGSAVPTSFSEATSPTTSQNANAIAEKVNSPKHKKSH